MWVTLYADASFSPKDGGGWGVWIRSERGRIVQRGKCPPYVLSSGAAELCAIYVGVHLALRAWGAEVRGVFVRSDSQEALLCAMPTAPLARNDAMRRLQRRLRALLGSGVELHTRWVKGHQGAARGTAAYLNTAVDRLARRGRKEQRS